MYYFIPKRVERPVEPLEAGMRLHSVSLMRGLKAKFGHSGWYGHNAGRRTLAQEESNHLCRCVGTADIRKRSAGMAT